MLKESTVFLSSNPVQAPPCPPHGMKASVLMFHKTCVLFSDEIHIYRVQFPPLAFYSLNFFHSSPPPFRFLLKFYPFDCILLSKHFLWKLKYFCAAYIYLDMWPSTKVRFSYQGLKGLSLTHHLTIANDFLARERGSLYPLSMLGFLFHLRFSRS